MNCLWKLMTYLQLTGCMIYSAAVPLTATGGEKLSPLDQSVAEKISYRKEVWPILKRHCWGCHSGADPKGGLSLDAITAMRKGGETGPLFEIGKPDQSLLVEQITGEIPAMPPKGMPLSETKIRILRHWILGGAKDDGVNSEPTFAVSIPSVYKFAPIINSVAFSIDGKRIAVACRSEVVLIDVEGDTPPKRIPTESDLLSHVEFSPDGKVLAAAGGSPSRYGEVTFFQAETGKLIAKRRLGYDTFFRGNFSPDSQTIALGGADGAIHLIPLDPKGKPRQFELHSDWVFDVAYTADGKMLVSGGRDKSIKVSSVETGDLLRTLDSSTDWITSVAADEQFAIASGQARTLTGYELKIALQNIQVTGSGNGARPISRLNQYVKRFEAQPGEVRDIATSGNRKAIALAGVFGEVRVYQLTDRKRIASVPKISNPVFSIALNQDASRLAVGGKEGTVHIYQLPDGKLLKSVTPVPVIGNPAEMP